MSRMTALGAVLLCTAVMAVAPPGASAQQTEEEMVAYLLELQPRLDAAREEAEAATLRYEADLRNSQEATVDTFRVGPLTVVAALDQVDEAREMYGRIWEREFAPVVTHSDALDNSLFTFSWAASPPRIVMTGPHHRAEARLWHSKAEVERRVKGAIGKALEDDIRLVENPRDGLHGWARGAIGRPEKPDWLYRQLATNPSKISRACLDGVPMACWTALGTEIGDDSLERWYTQDERRMLALRFAWQTRENKPLRDACEDGHFDRCDEVLAQFANVRSLTPVTWDGRMVMVWVALEMGGEGAWDRLVEDPDMAPAEALLYASGATPEELEARWRDLVLEYKPEVHAGLSTTKWMVLFWVLVFTAFAMRSTRWRLG